MKIYKTILRPIVTYCAENWTLTKESGMKFCILGSKKIFGSVCEKADHHIKVIGTGQ